MNNKGITLVALVVTVIILTILATVSIVVLVGQDGLIEKTKTEAATYDLDVITDDVKLAIINAKKYGTGEITEQNLRKALDNQLGEENYSLTKKDEGNAWTITVKDYNFDVDNVTFDPNSTVELSGDSLARNVKVGDYVAYNPTKTNADGTESVESSKLTYTSYANTDKANTSGNGSATQTFTANSNIKWRVLDVNKQTGVVALVSETPISTDSNAKFAARGAKGYLYIEQELNEICKIYGYGYGANTNLVTTYQYGDENADGGFKTGTITGSGARSIKLEDIDKICGIDEFQKSICAKSPINVALGEKWGPTKIYYPTISTATGLSNSDTNVIVTNSCYGYKGRKYLPETGEEPYKMIFRNVADTSEIRYLLATRQTYGNTAFIDFGVAVVINESIISATYLESKNETYDEDERIGEKNYSAGVRPVVFLLSSMKTSGKNQAGAWILD